MYLLHADLKLVILLSQFGECWDYMGVLPYHSFLILIIKYVPILREKSNLIYHFDHLKSEMCHLESVKHGHLIDW